MDALRRVPGRPAPPTVDGTPATSSVVAPASRPPVEKPAPAQAPIPTGVAATAGHHAFPPARLNAALSRTTAALAELQRAGPPGTLLQLADGYAALGRMMADAQACLLSALDALDVRSPAGRANPAAPFEAVRQRAFGLLREIGAAFAAMEPSFGTLVHGGGGWPARPVVVQEDRGDGVPLRHYENTFKKAEALDPEQRRAEFQKRVDKFTNKGGRFEDIITARPGVFADLPPGIRHDYVLLPDGTLRLNQNHLDDDSGPAKPGHSLLATGGPTFVDTRALLAGELVVFKDSAGDVEAVMVANNSGHFKPRYEDLANAVPALAALGVPPEKVILCGGPNNLHALLREIGAKLETDLSGKLPPEPRDVLVQWAATPASGRAWSMRLNSRD